MGEVGFQNDDIVTKIYRKIMYAALDCKPHEMVLNQRIVSSPPIWGALSFAISSEALQQYHTQQTKWNHSDVDFNVHTHYRYCHKSLLIISSRLPVLSSEIIKNWWLYYVLLLELRQAHSLQAAFEHLLAHFGRQADNLKK